MISDFHFIRPEWLLAVIPAILLWFSLHRRHTQLGALTQVIDPHLLKHLLLDPSKGKQLKPLNWLTLIWTVAIIALAGPTWKQAPAPFADEQAGLFVLLRVSPTMLAEDVPPTRLDRARHKLSELLARRQGAATGLIAYHGSAHLVMPLTRDTHIINTMAESLHPDIMPRDGNALNDAIQLAEDHFQRASTPGSIVILTDQLPSAPPTAPTIPIQILAIHPFNSTLPSDTVQNAKKLNARITQLSIDNQDVERIAQRAHSDFKQVNPQHSGQHWQDAGYALLPALALLSLARFRKGWQL